MINLQYTTIQKPLPDFIYQGIRPFCTNANTYYPQPLELINKIAIKFNLLKEKIFLTAGADEAIQLFAKAFGSNAYVFTPTYIVYQDVEVFGGRLNRVYSIDKNFEYKISSQKIKDATLIYLANPNNPSGYTDRATVVNLIRNNPKALVVIDETYGDFADLSVINETERYSNLAVIRSFSKSYCMAGNRIGFVVANKTIIDKISPLTQWANISYLSVGAALTALDHEDYFRELREEVRKTREDFNVYLKKHGYVTISSLINAQLIKFNSEAEAEKFVSFLKENNILVTHGNGLSNIGLDQSFVRIAIGNEQQMKEVKTVIGRFRSFNELKKVALTNAPLK